MAFVHAAAHSQAAASGEGAFTVTPAFVTAFVDRGAYMSGLSFRPTVAYSKGPLAFELFGNFPISDKVPGTADPQIDLAASYTWETAPGALAIEPSVLLSTFPRADTDEGFYRAICELGVSFRCELAEGLNASLGFWRDVVQKGGGYELGLEYSAPFRLRGLGAELSARIGRYDLSDTVINAPEKVRNYGDYLYAGVSIPYEFSDKSKLAVGWCYAKGTRNYTQAGHGEREPNPCAVGRGVFTFSFSRPF